MKNFNKYLPIGAPEEEWGFYINTVGFSKYSHLDAYPNNKEHPPGHAFTWDKGRILNGYYLVFISKGEGYFESSQVAAKKVSAGSCFFLFPEVWHRYKPNKSSGWEEYWVGFNGTYPQSLMGKGFFDPHNPVINTNFNEPLLFLFHKLIDTVKMATAGYHQVITGITLEILGLVNAIAKHEGQDNEPTQRLISKAKYLLQESIDHPINMEQMVKELPMGYSKFRKAFKSITGVSPHQYYMDIRLAKARELLLLTTLNVDEVAYYTGFDEPAYFSKLFKKKNGVSPLMYRKDRNVGPAF
jgi:AraC-like DNA-binding protein